MNAKKDERARIEDMYARAEARRDSDDDDNMADYFRLRARANEALAAWREKYPEAAAEEDRQARIVRAECLAAIRASSE